MMLGIHCSVSGGLSHAFDEAESLGIDTFQIFTRNQRQWNAKPISLDEAAAFSERKKKSGIEIIFSHASYLINLASADEVLWKKSVDAITNEVKRCHDLGLAYTVLHPGAAGESSVQDAIGRIAKALQSALKATAHSGVKILLENTAGQGSAIGYRFEHLRQIMDLVDSKRLGSCFDTCHAFAAGYDLRTEIDTARVFEEFDRVVGLDRLCAIHLNDSKGDLGSRLDRHEHIGKGKIGVAAFAYILRHFKKIPKVIETDKEDNMDAVNLAVLRKLGQ